MRATIAATAASLLLLSACTGGGGSDVADDPGGSLRAALDELNDYEGVRMTFSAEGDAAALAEDDEERQALELLFSSTVTLAVSADEDDPQVELRVDLGGTDVFELRVTDGPRLFARADLDAFAEAVDDPSITADLDGLVASASFLGLQDVAQAVVEGEWIELVGIDDLTDLAESFGGGEFEEPTEEEARELQEQLVAALDRFVDEDVEVSYVGSEAAGERVRASTDGASLQRLLDEVTAILGEASGFDPGMVAPQAGDEIPADLRASIDVWLDGGRISQFGVDLAELAPDEDVPEGTLILLAIEEFTGGVEAPADAEPFDLFGLLGGFLGGFGDPGAGGFGDPGADGFEDLDDLDLDQGDVGGFEDECLTPEMVEEFGFEDLVEAGLVEVC